MDAFNTNYFANVQKWADGFARSTTETAWTDVQTKKCLSILANSSLKTGSQNTEARRAERLVLALDRLVAALPEYKNNEPVQSSLNQLFKLAQSIPDFDPKQFADALQIFSAAIAAKP